MRTFVESALAGNQAAATAVAIEIAIAAQSRTAVIGDLFEPAQRYITDRWQVGEATGEDEYRVSRAIAAAMRSLSRLERSHPEQRSKALLVTIRPEEHDLGLDLVAAAMADDVWSVEVIRAAEPMDLIQRNWRFGFDLLAVSSTYATGQFRGEMTSVIRSWHEAGVPVLVGGLAFSRFPHLAEQIGADSVARDARGAVVIARHLRLQRRRWALRRHSTAV